MYNGLHEGVRLLSGEVGKLQGLVEGLNGRLDLLEKNGVKATLPGKWITILIALFTGVFTWLFFLTTLHIRG